MKKVAARFRKSNGIEHEGISKKEQHERALRTFAHQELVLFDSGEHWKSSVLEYSSRGDVINFEGHKYARPFDTNRQIIVETASGNKYYIKGENIINVRESFEKGEVVYGPANNIPEFEIGEPMTVKGYGGEGWQLDTSSVKKVSMQYKVYTGEPSLKHRVEHSVDPFTILESRLAELPVPESAVAFSE